MEKIKIKSLFGEWHSATEEQALVWAKQQFKSITTGRDDNHTLEIMHNRLEGVRFTRDQVR